MAVKECDSSFRCLFHRACSERNLGYLKLLRRTDQSRRWLLGHAGSTNPHGKLSAEPQQAPQSRWIVGVVVVHWRGEAKALQRPLPDAQDRRARGRLGRSGRRCIRRDGKWLTKLKSLLSKSRRKYGRRLSAPPQHKKYEFPSLSNMPSEVFGRRRVYRRRDRQLRPALPPLSFLFRHRQLEPILGEP